MADIPSPSPLPDSPGWELKRRFHGLAQHYRGGLTSAECYDADAVEAALALTREQQADKEYNIRIALRFSQKEVEILKAKLATVEQQAQEQATEITRLKLCRHGHEWSNQFGDDWTPDDDRPCDCGEKTWGQRSTVEQLKARLATVEAARWADETCPWHCDGEGGWQGSCGIRADDTLRRNGQLYFCPLCGKRVDPPAQGKA